MSNIFRYTILTILSLSMFSCEFNYPEVVEVRELAFTGYNPLNKTLGLSFKPTVYNPNDLSFWVDKVETEIYFDGVSLGTSTTDERIELKAKGNSSFNLKQKVKVDAFLAQLRSAIQKDSIKVELDGKYSFKASKLDIKVPYVYETWVYPKKDLSRLLLGL